jgi:two-component system nitrogen regulation sensor histidine kinase NtrY
MEAATAERPAQGAATGGDPSGTPIGGASGWAFWLGVGAMLLALVSGVATSLILTGLTSIRPTGEVFVLVILANLLLVLPLIGVIAWQIWALWRARRQQAAGSRLHLRIVGLFSVIALLPAILLAAFASISLNRALNEVFSNRIKRVVENSLDVARTYVEEHGMAIRSDLVAMGRDLDHSAALVKSNPQAFKALFTTQAALRDLPLAYLIDEQGKVMIAPDRALSQPYLPPPPGAIADAKAGQAVIIAPGRSTRVGAVKRLESFADVYLYVLRPVDARVLQHLSRTEEGVRKYRDLEQFRRGTQIASGIMYVVIALTLLLAAIWLGLWFANRLVSPIRRLIGAAQRVREGDLSVKVPIRRGEGDMKQLAITFNRMTSELEKQRGELVAAHDQIDERRRFIEAVLSGVTAGVLGIDSEGRIRLTNPSAEQLLAKPRRELVGRPLAEAVPELASLLEEASEPTRKVRPQAQITLAVNEVERTFAVRVTHEQAGAEQGGTVITFDDITELVSAQRTSAWADVARRIAHEIKNPLTPIQLSAERLRRKYGRAISEDRETFDKLTETIERQAGHIKSMVDEFASFARMPKPEFEECDLRDVVREPVLLFREGHPEIEILFRAPAERILATCDRRLVSQAVTNLVKNATEAIAAVSEGKEPQGYKGRIEVRLATEPGLAMIEVVDNGIGLPKQNRGRLIEPYVTTRAKGTGLGLAIVQKIIEQHHGSLALEDAPALNGHAARGALVRMTLPLRPVRREVEATAPGTASHDKTPAERQRDPAGTPG